MKTLLPGLAAVAAALTLGCSADETAIREYQNNDLVLAAQHAARDACSCLFVMELDEDLCKAWLRASPDVARFSVNRQARTVEASALILWGARARHVDDRFGCVLE
jgi:hypothetical protein